jgi:hypothetical protein
VVCAVPEAELVGRLACDVEAVGVAVAALVAIRARDHHEDADLCRQVDAVDVAVAGEPAPEVLKRRLEA